MEITGNKYFCRQHAEENTSQSSHGRITMEQATAWTSIEVVDSGKKKSGKYGQPAKFEKDPGEKGKQYSTILQAFLLC